MILSRGQQRGQGRVFGSSHTPLPPAGRSCMGWPPYSWPRPPLYAILAARGLGGQCLSFSRSLYGQVASCRGCETVELRSETGVGSRCWKREAKQKKSNGAVRASYVVPSSKRVAFVKAKGEATSGQKAATEVRREVKENKCPKNKGRDEG